MSPRDIIAQAAKAVSDRQATSVRANPDDLKPLAEGLQELNEFGPYYLQIKGPEQHGNNVLITVNRLSTGVAVFTALPNGHIKVVDLLGNTQTQVFERQDISSNRDAALQFVMERIFTTVGPPRLPKDQNEASTLHVAVQQAQCG